jgi:hypothetical protein
MDKLLVVGQILNTCLTTETLNRLSPSATCNRVFSDQTIAEVKRKLFVDLLEHVGRIVQEELNRDASPDEVILIFNRVKQFLTARELY